MLGDTLCRVGWHGGVVAQDVYCVGFGEKYALFECARCGARNAKEQGYLTDEQQAQLQEKERGPQTF